MISKSTLNKWRKEALKVKANKVPDPSQLGLKEEYNIQELQRRILRMTQDLLDLHLTREK